ncbi:MAG TPA: hypothetical protein VMJ10_04455 [Kofleriaceae bacterium]|nr:hypothetical protein [Kofleriaceae bacterium]
MRFHVLVLGALVALAACGGATSNDVKAARTAHYKGDKMQIFQAVKAAVETKYKIDRVDENQLLIETSGRWYTPEGLGVSERMDDIRDVPANSLHIHFLVALVADGDSYVVDVKGKWLKYIANSPKPQPLGEDDISVYGYAYEKRDALSVAIHDGLKTFEVQGVPAMVPAGSGAPAPAPAAPAPAAPAPAAPAPAPAAPAPAPAQ